MSCAKGLRKRKALDWVEDTGIVPQNEDRYTGVMEWGLLGHSWELGNTCLFLGRLRGLGDRIIFRDGTYKLIRT